MQKERYEERYCEDHEDFLSAVEGAEVYQSQGFCACEVSVGEEPHLVDVVSEMDTLVSILACAGWGEFAPFIRPVRTTRPALSRRERRRRKIGPFDKQPTYVRDLSRAGLWWIPVPQDYLYQLNDLEHFSHGVDMPDGRRFMLWAMEATEKHFPGASRYPRFPEYDTTFLMALTDEGALYLYTDHPGGPGAFK